MEFCSVFFGSKLVHRQIAYNLWIHMGAHVNAWCGIWMENMDKGIRCL